MSPLEDLLDKIAAGLREIDDCVYYGTAARHPVKSRWDYTVFSRSTTAPKGNLTGFTDRFTVSVVREGFVPSDILGRVIDAMTAIPGMKVDESKDVEYLYEVKPSTTCTLEMMTVSFSRGRKR